MAEFSLEALKDEIVNDSQSLGYKNSATPNDWKEDQEIADLINAKNLVVDRDEVGMDEIRSVIEFGWYDRLSPDEQEYTRWQTPGGGGEDGGGNWKVSAHMKLLLSGRALVMDGVAGTGSNNASYWNATDRDLAAPAILALIEMSGSRAEVLWGVGRTITASNVGGSFNEI